MDDQIKQGATAFKAGDLESARKLLSEAVKQSPDDERAWGWMYNVCTTDQERILCLKQMVRINPQNEKAQNSLLKLENTISIAPFLQNETSVESRLVLRKISNRNVLTKLANSLKMVG